jgi:GntR family histidine utilization transcriptional repressor
MPVPKKTAALPAYEQIKSYIKTQISEGQWLPGDAVPSESALQKRFGLSRMTVNRAVKELAVEGVVTRLRGSGTVVAQLHQISSSLQQRDIREEVVERGHVPGARVLLVEKVRADKTLAQVFQVRTLSTLFHSVIVHLENGIPIQLEDPTSTPRVRRSTWSRTSW